MRTDTLFYQIFQLLPEILGQLLGRDASTAHYDFKSVEIKELARSIDGVFFPPKDKPNQTIYFAEFQVQRDEGLYERLVTESFMYLGQYRPERFWQIVAIWIQASLDPGIPKHYQKLYEEGCLKVIYLDRLSHSESLSIGLLQLMVAKAKQPQDLQPQVIQLWQLAANFVQNPREREIIDLIDKVLLCKFPTLTLKEWKEMFELADVKKTRVYQDAVDTGKVLGKLESVPVLARMGASAEVIAKELGLALELVREAMQSSDSID
jgi:predicted transposase/invertase (TIGR01784 family)